MDGQRGDATSRLSGTADGRVHGAQVALAQAVQIAATLPALTLDADIGVTSINAAAAECFGLTETDPSRVGMASLFVDAVAAQAFTRAVAHEAVAHEAVAHEAFARGTANPQSTALLRVQGGDARWFQLDVSWHGAFAVVIAKDVHALQCALLSAAAERDRMRAFFEHAADSFIVHDEHGRVLEANAATIAMLGYPLDELLTMSVPDFNPDVDTARLARVLASARSGRSAGGRTRHRHRDGHDIAVEVHSVRVDLGERPTYLALTRDISTRVQHEQQLRVVIAELERQIAVAGDLLFVLCDEARIERANEHALRSLDATAEGIIGGSLLEHVHPEDVSEAQAMLQHVADGQLSDARVLRLVTRAETPLWVECRIARFGASLYLSARDVSEHKHAERALIESRELAESSARMKSVFLSTMSHEIRTPLNGVLGIASLLAESSLDDDQRQLVSTLQSAGESLLSVVNDVLDFSRAESGAVVLERVPFDIRALLHDVCALLRPQAFERKLRLGVSISAAVPSVLRGDSNRIRQILLNLAGNAVKFTHDGGVLIQLDYLRSENRDVLRLRVADTGIGISAADISKLFTRFEQGDASTPRRYGGSGLGLSIVRHLVTLMDGSIAVHSEPGEGTTFECCLPLPIAAVDAAAAQLPAPRPDGALVDRWTARVLLVEDNNINQLVASRMVEHLGCSCTTAVNGLEAVHAFAQGEFDLVLMDWHMPVMDGIEATRRIRAMPDGVNVPIVALTADAFDEDRQICLNAGMNAHLTKPLRISDLRNVLARFCEDRGIDSATARVAQP